MNQPKRSWPAAAALALSSLLIGASARAPFDPLRAVPKGALAVLTVANPQSLAINAARFLRAAGFEKEAAQAEAALAPFFGGTEAPEDEALAKLAAIIDPKRRFVTAVYPGEGDPEDVSVLLLVPIKSGPDAEAAIGEAVQDLAPGAGEVTVSLEFPGYLIAGAKGFDAGSVGQAEAVDLSRLAKLPASSLAVWVDVGVGSTYVELLKQGLGSLIPGSGRASPEAGQDYWTGQAETEEGGGDSGIGNDAPQAEEAEDGGLGNDGALGNDAEAEGDESEAEYEEPADGQAAESGVAVGNDESVGNDGSLGNGDSAGNGVDEAEGDDAEGGGYAEDYDWDDGSGPPAVPELGKLVEWLLAFADEISSVELTLNVQPDKAWLRMGARVADGSKLASYASKASSGDPSLPYLSFCEADALMSFAWSSPADWAMPLLRELYGIILPDPGLLEATMGGYAAYAAASGPNGAMSIGLGVSEELARLAKSGSGPSDDQIAEVLARGLDFQVSGAMQLSDRQAFRDAAASMLDVAKTPAYSDLLKTSGIGLEIDRKVGLVKGLPYDAYNYRFSAGGESGPEAIVTELLGRIMTPVYVYKDDKAYLGFGKPERALDTITRGGAAVPLRADKAFKALRAGAPTDARALYYISTKAIWRLVMRFMPEGTPPLGFNVNDLSGLLSWFDASPGTMGFGFGVGAEDVKSISALARM